MNDDDSNFRSEYVIIDSYNTMEKSTNVIEVEVNGVKYNISNASAKTSLNEWLRSQPGLKGTKVTCQEGGCGCCIVALTKPDPVTNKPKTQAVNSCLFALHAADGFKITTTEGLGSSRKGYHPIQQRIAEYNGSQCGYCTPGMVMNMYSLLSEDSQPTKQKIEDGFDGNICRCTGFRPILDAMKSFAKDESPIDIEDLHKCPCIENCCDKPETRFCQGPCYNNVQTSDPTWYKATTLKDLYNMLSSFSTKSVQLVAGNTGHGVYKNEGDFDVYIGIVDIPELNEVKITDSYLQLGAALSLNSVIQELQTYSEKSKSFEVLASHIKKIANVAVRNVGSWAGNLMVIHKHRDFPSDVYTIMETVGSKINIGSIDGSVINYSLEEFLSLEMKDKVILNIVIPFSATDEIVKTFKIMPRHQNAHAYVNAGFRASIDSNFTIKGVPSLVFGGVKLAPIHATQTEQFLSGKRLLDATTLQDCLDVLSKEVIPESTPVMASAEYRKSLALALFYKFFLSLLGDKASARVRSAAIPYIRPISSGKQSYDTTKSEYPLTEPMTKMTAKLQASGEAQYTDDISKQQGELYAAFVTTTKGNCKLSNVDPSAALNIPGVLKFITAKDIPGKNDFVSLCPENEEIFCSGNVSYAGQSVGIIVAESQALADEAASKVVITYSDCQPPVITIEDAIKASSFFSNQIKRLVVGDADAAMKSSTHVITGEISLGTQHHFHMETHTCLCIPGEEEMTVFASTQATDNTQRAIAEALNMAQKSVNVSVRRCGGAYGGKIMRDAQNSTACAVAAYVMNRPVRMRMNFKTNMEMVGKRFPYLAKYKVGFSANGSLNAVEIAYYTACGNVTNENSLSVLLNVADNAYRCENWKLVAIPCKTNTATNAFCRAPGTLPSIFITETFMNHVAKTLNTTPEKIKQLNFYQKGQTSFIKQPLTYCSMSKIWQELMTSSEYETRRAAIETFNKENRWRKQGICVVPLKYGVHYWTYCHFAFPAYVAIYRKDGTVAIVHGGVEIGQGINTKVCQVAAYCLGFGLSVDQISVKPNSSLMNPNGWPTAASITSELCCKSVIECCNILRERISPIAKEMPEATWVEILDKCFSVGIDLSAKYMACAPHDDPFVYNTYGATCTEVEVDVLTGETEVLRTDILYDCGKSMNPEIDIGQVEGAFVMGLGYWLTEKAIYDPSSGLELTHGTWDYHPPSSKDIPIDFRISLLKDAPNPLGILRSKAVGEPPQCMSCSSLFAVQDAIYSARAEIGNDKEHFALNGPATVESTQLQCLVDASQFVI